MPDTPIPSPARSDAFTATASPTNSMPQPATTSSSQPLPPAARPSPARSDAFTVTRSDANSIPHPGLTANVQSPVAARPSPASVAESTCSVVVPSAVVVPRPQPHSGFSSPSPDDFAMISNRPDGLRSGAGPAPSSLKTSHVRLACPAHSQKTRSSTASVNAKILNASKLDGVTPEPVPTNRVTFTHSSDDDAVPTLAVKCVTPPLIAYHFPSNETQVTAIYSNATPVNNWPYTFSVEPETVQLSGVVVLSHAVARNASTPDISPCSRCSLREKTATSSDVVLPSRTTAHAVAGNEPDASTVMSRILADPLSVAANLVDSPVFRSAYVFVSKSGTSTWTCTTPETTARPIFPDANGSSNTTGVPWSPATGTRPVRATRCANSSAFVAWSIIDPSTAKTPNRLTSTTDVFLTNTIPAFLVSVPVSRVRPIACSRYAAVASIIVLNVCAGMCSGSPGWTFFMAGP